MRERFGTDMYNGKYSEKEENEPRSVVTYFVDKYLIKSKNCLDLGSGAGRHSRYIADKGINVTAIDLSEEGIRKTKGRLKNHPNSHVVLGDVHRLPFADKSFDSIVCNRVLDYNDDQGLEASFSEIERILKNGGIILITVRSLSQTPKKEEVLISENNSGGKSFKVSGGQQIQHYFSEQEIVNLARRHNLKIVEIRENRHQNSQNDQKSEWQVILRNETDTQE